MGVEELRALAFSADGKSLVTLGQVQQGIGSQEIRLWDVGEGKKRWQVSRQGYGAQSLAFAPDGHSIAVFEGGGIALLTATTGEELRRLTAKEALNNVQRIAFSPDGRTLAVAGLQPDGRTGRIYIWELSTGTVRHDLIGHQGMIASLAFAPDGSKLATGGWDTSILLWDLVGKDAEAKANPAAKELDEMWAGLDNTDGKEGFRAMGRLLAAPAEAVGLFKKNIEPVKGEKSDAEKIAQWVADLDHKRFNKRDEASKSLELMGRAAEAELKKALDDKPSPEKKKRITELLGKLQSAGIKPELVRPLRAIEVLERLGTTESRQLLETLSGGAPEARLTREAKATLERVIKATKPTS
jgi:dipeptidyl aminopeptidase/acylaminoacyl peptidase